MIKNIEITAEIIANYFLTKSKIGQKKIQKLVYYAYSWYITSFNESSDNVKNILFDEVPEAQIHGPVFPSFHTKYRCYGWNDIPKYTKKIEFEDERLTKFLDEIWNLFGVYSADDLEYMTQIEDPRINAISKTYKPNKISIKDIFEFYSELERKYGSSN